jgi:hypothetical protein
MAKLTLVHDYVFPGFNVPNALNPHFAIMNYIISQYNDKSTYSTFLENNMDWFKAMFDNSMGQTQNTLSGFIIEANVYANKIDFEYDSLYSTLTKNKKFIYPIKPNPVFHNFCGGINSGTDENKNYGDYFWKFISKRALNEIKKKRGIILIDYSMEPFLSYGYHKMLHDSLRGSNIDKDSIYIVVNSFNAKELYEKWFNPHARMYNVINTPFCLEHSSYYYDDILKRNDGKVMDISKFLETKDTLRQNHFLMKIKRPKEHRLKILINLIDDDFVNLVDWSFSGEANFSNTNEFRWAIRNMDLKNLNKISEILDKSPYNLQSENNLSFGKVNAWTDETYEPHINSYFDICFESFFYNNSETLSLTEKIFKPIINFQPFIFISTPGSIKLLRDLGFKTFDGFIDESYDDIIDNDERIKKAYLEIKKLCLLSKEEIHNLYWQMEDILIHNHNHLLSIHNNKMITEAFFEKLYDKLK